MTRKKGEPAGRRDEQMLALAEAMAAPLKRSFGHESLGRRAFRTERLRCRTCGLPYEDGEAIGCRECVTRSVMES